MPCPKAESQRSRASRPPHPSSTTEATPMEFDPHQDRQIRKFSGELYSLGRKMGDVEGTIEPLGDQPRRWWGQIESSEDLFRVQRDYLELRITVETIGALRVYIELGGGGGGCGQYQWRFKSDGPGWIEANDA